MQPMRILLVDDHVLLRKGLASLIDSRPDMEVVGEAANGLEAISRARELLPDIILMDISMPECDGLEATRRIKRELPSTKIVMLTVSDDHDDLFAAIRAGAEGYLLKDLDPLQLFTLLEGVCRGEAPLSGKVATKILQELKDSKDSPRPQPEPAFGEELTSRELEVLELVAQGNTNKEIAEALCVTENTVKIHLRNILDKLHLHNRVQAAVYAVRRGLASDLPPDH